MVRLLSTVIRPYLLIKRPGDFFLYVELFRGIYDFLYPLPKLFSVLSSEEVIVLF